MEEKNVARFPRPVYGRIPNFLGSEDAAKKLFKLKEWGRSLIVKVNPDAPQYPVRLQALRDGKLLLMPTPRLRSGFLLLDPNKIPRNAYDKAATIRGAFTYGHLLDIEGLRGLGRVDLIVEGSVAVTLKGRRLGKGGGYGELEYAILKELNLVDEKTPIATTVHEIQIVDNLPIDPWDVPVDIIATPKRLIKVDVEDPRPKGVIWKAIPASKLRETPILQELKKYVLRSSPPQQYQY